jgi:putative transcriptional regulator
LQVTEADGAQRIAKRRKMRDMSEDEVHAAALSDPDAQPWTEEQLKRTRLVPRVRTMRRALGLTQEEFAKRYRIPLGTLRDWEQGKCEPDQASKAYLTVIVREPERVRRALEPRSA